MAKKTKTKNKPAKKNFAVELENGDVALIPSYLHKTWCMARDQVIRNWRTLSGSTIKGVQCWGLDRASRLLPPGYAALLEAHIVHLLCTRERDWQLWFGVFTKYDGDLGCESTVMTIPAVTSRGISDRINRIAKKLITEFDEANPDSESMGYGWVAIPTLDYDLSTDEYDEQFVEYFDTVHDITNVERRKQLVTAWRLENGIEEIQDIELEVA